VTTLFVKYGLKKRKNKFETYSYEKSISYNKEGMWPSCTTKSAGVSTHGAKPCLELRHITVERNSENERWHLSQPITLLYDFSLLAAMRWLVTCMPQ